jgi:hypothetical protein
VGSGVEFMCRVGRFNQIISDPNTNSHWCAKSPIDTDLPLVGN